MNTLFAKSALSLSLSLSILGLVACSTDSQLPLQANLQGAELPFSTLEVKDKAAQSVELRNGGYGSDMVAHPTEAKQFYALTDRGPNAKYKGDLGKGKIFPVPEYTPRIGLFEVDRHGEVELVKEILLKRPDGTPITGLPNARNLGGTGETPYHTNGTPITVKADQPFDAQNNPVKLDNFGLDGEGLVALNDGTFWVSDEYGPHIVHFDANGVEIERINPFSGDERAVKFLPAEFAKRRPNRGMEGLAITPDEKTLVGIMQSTMYNPSKAVKKLDITRIVTVNLETNEVAQYLYRQEKAQNANSGIVALSNTEFAVIERDGKFLKDDPKAMKRIYRIDLATATNLETVSISTQLKQDDTLGLTIAGETLEQVVLNQGWEGLTAHNIVPVEKSLVVDLVAAVGYKHDKLEGMWLINDSTMGFLNDDDFAAWSEKGVLKQKYLDNDNTDIDSNRLYILDGLNLTSAK